jgi:threonine aldolase
MPTPSAIPGYFLQFASDNTAGVCPEALAAFNAANAGFVPSYGEDATTRDVCDHIRALFATDCDVYFSFNGTAANSLALAAMCQSYQGVICAESAHVETDECGAPEFFSNGAKLLLAPQRDGKLDAVGVEHLITRRRDLHYPRPKVVTLTQTTEMGTLYTAAEISAVTRLAKQHGLRTHMDGARFANAIAALDVAPADITWRAGIDVLCFGGTKMGLPIGEAIVFFDRALGEEFSWRCKQAGQLASKMRFLSAPWLAMLENQTWLRHAGHANQMAQRLAQHLGELPGIELLPTQANGVFVNLSAEAMVRIREKGWSFHTFIGGVARFMCSWASTEAAVDHLAADIAASL